jgi:trans-aconitate methyltransferase
LVAFPAESLAQYVIGDAQSWKPPQPADVVMAQELLYLVDDPQQTVSHLVAHWLAPGGRFIAAVDCFKENKASHSWAEDLGVPMHCLPESAWRRILREAGLGNVEAWRTKPHGPWQGTLILTGVRE